MLFRSHQLESESVVSTQQRGARGAYERGAIEEARTRWQPTSPVWTREDESAASLLLQIGSSTSNSSRSETKSVSPPSASTNHTNVGRKGDVSEQRRRVTDQSKGDEAAPRTNVNVGMEAQTPGRLLGIRTKLS